MRPFAKWCGKEIEVVVARNDHPRPGKELKPPWETVPVDELYMKIHEEMFEAIEAYSEWLEYPTDKNRDALKWELADVATTAMMMSANLDKIMSGLRRGRVRGREFPV